MQVTPEKMRPYAKAVYGAVVGALLAFLGALATALTGDATSLGDLTDGQWITAVVAGLGALPLIGTTVYSVTNRGSTTTTTTEEVV